jgi:hypothetical protein
METRPDRVELLFADGQTDVTKVIVELSNYTKAPKRVNFVPVENPEGMLEVKEEPKSNCIGL